MNWQKKVSDGIAGRVMEKFENDLKLFNFFTEKRFCISFLRYY